MPLVLQNPKLNYGVHNSPPLERGLSQINPLCILTLSSPLCVGLTSGIICLGFPTKILYNFLVSGIHAACPTSVTLLELIAVKVFG
jgi:hypothetical protein